METQLQGNTYNVQFTIPESSGHLFRALAAERFLKKGAVRLDDTYWQLRFAGGGRDLLQMLWDEGILPKTAKVQITIGGALIYDGDGSPPRATRLP